MMRPRNPGQGARGTANRTRHRDHRRTVVTGRGSFLPPGISKLKQRDESIGMEGGTKATASIRPFLIYASPWNGNRPLSTPAPLWTSPGRDFGQREVRSPGVPPKSMGSREEPSHQSTLRACGYLREEVDGHRTTSARRCPGAGRWPRREGVGAGATRLGTYSRSGSRNQGSGSGERSTSASFNRRQYRPASASARQAATTPPASRSASLTES